MDFLGAWDLILTVGCLICGILLLMGKGDFLVNDKNSSQRNKEYDMDKAKKGFGVMLLLVAGVTVLNSYLNNFICSIIYIFVIVGLFAGSFAYMKVACKKTKPVKK